MQPRIGVPAGFRRIDPLDQRLGLHRLGLVAGERGQPVPRLGHLVDRGLDRYLGFVERAGDALRDALGHRAQRQEYARHAPDGIGDVLEQVAQPADHVAHRPEDRDDALAFLGRIPDVVGQVLQDRQHVLRKLQIDRIDLRLDVVEGVVEVVGRLERVAVELAAHVPQLLPKLVDTVPTEVQELDQLVAGLAEQLLRQGRFERRVVQFLELLRDLRQQVLQRAELALRILDADTHGAEQLRLLTAGIQRLRRILGQQLQAAGHRFDVGAGLLGCIGITAQRLSRQAESLVQIVELVGFVDRILDAHRDGGGVSRQGNADRSADLLRGRLNLAHALVSHARGLIHATFEAADLGDQVERECAEIPTCHE